MKHPRPLPAQVRRLLDTVDAPPRLRAHLALVHDMACEIVSRLDSLWPILQYDRDAVRLGAAIHDIGKCVVPTEITGPGHTHETMGEALLIAHGWPDRVARFARTHGRWAELTDLTLEDLLVALADNWWRGRRDVALEAILCRTIADDVRAPEWEVAVAVADLGDDLAVDADARLVWQS